MNENARRVYVMAHSNGGRALVDFFKKLRRRGARRRGVRLRESACIAKIALTDSYHSLESMRELLLADKVDKDDVDVTGGEADEVVKDEDVDVTGGEADEVEQLRGKLSNPGSCINYVPVLADAEGVCEVGRPYEGEFT